MLEYIIMYILLGIILGFVADSKNQESKRTTISTLIALLAVIIAFITTGPFGLAAAIEIGIGWFISNSIKDFFSSKSDPIIKKNINHTDDLKNKELVIENKKLLSKLNIANSTIKKLENENKELQTKLRNITLKLNSKF